MGEPQGPLDRAATRLGDLVHLLKNSIIPGLRSKDQQAILTYLLAMTDDLMAAKAEIDGNRVTEAEKQRLAIQLRRDWQVEVDQLIAIERMKWNMRIKEEVSKKEREMQEQFRDWVLQSHIGDPDD